MNRISKWAKSKKAKLNSERKSIKNLNYMDSKSKGGDENDG
jgi:hypothetical protein